MLLIIESGDFEYWIMKKAKKYSIILTFPVIRLLRRSQKLGTIILLIDLSHSRKQKKKLSDLKDLNKVS
jgi:hypothetical protein